MALEEIKPFLEGSGDEIETKRHESRRYEQYRHLTQVLLLINVLLLIVCAILSAAVLHLTTAGPKMSCEDLPASVEIAEPYCKYFNASAVGSDT